MCLCVCVGGGVSLAGGRGPTAAACRQAGGRHSSMAAPVGINCQACLCPGTLSPVHTRARVMLHESVKSEAEETHRRVQVWKVQEDRKTKHFSNNYY